jgi:ABC-type arginine transport system permease subunit
MVDTIINALATQVPDLVVLLLIVWIFVKAIERRDKIYAEQNRLLTQEINALTEAIQAMNVGFVAHATEATMGIEDMHRTVLRQEKERLLQRPRKRNTKKK